MFSTSLALARSGWRSSVMSKQGKNGYQDASPELKNQSHQTKRAVILVHNTKSAVRTSPKLSLIGSPINIFITWYSR